MLEIDGSFGEGGGQILRSSVALSMLTGTAIRITKIRAGRKKPGLMRQHLTAIQSAARICDARLSGDQVRSSEITFEPGAIRPGDYHFAIGTAGSTTLVLQTVLPALLTAPGPSSLVLEGGTHNVMAPPFPFLADTYLPLINRMGPVVTAVLEKPGFYPAGGGRLRVEVRPSERLEGFEIHERGKVRVRRATALVAHLPRHIAERELRHVQKKMGWSASELHIEETDASDGPGNVLVLQFQSDALTETLTGFGEVGVRAESVAQKVVREARRYLKAEVPVGEHLADQLLLPLALAGRGGFTTIPLSRHATTQVDLIGRFLDVAITVERPEDNRVAVTVGAP